MEIHVINRLDAACHGPEVQDSSGRWQQVHLSQGSLDGACGPYSLFMALMICGVVDRDRLLDSRPDRRTHHGRLLREFDKYSGFFDEGTDLDGLVKAVQASHGIRVFVETTKESGKRVRRFIERHLLANHPVIVGLDSPEAAHWVVAVGVDYEQKGDSRALQRFLVLDPGEDNPRVSAWNGVIDASGSGGRYPYRYWWDYGTVDHWKVQLSEALALWPRQQPSGTTA